jgi:glucans biosynthesis protein
MHGRVGAGGARRPARAALALGICALAWLGPGAAAAFDLEDVTTQARALAGKPFREPRKVPRWLLDIGYDAWRDIRFRPERALWAEGGSPFTVQFFHPGLFYDRPVAIHVVDADGVRPVPFSPGHFDYGRNEFASRIPQDLGYAGFRVHYPIKRADYQDEVIVFLGATYMRAVGREQVFGLSARGLAVDTASPKGEEFPWFREFWLVRPARGAKELAIYALLDSPRITGAYRFVVRPGAQTQVDVEVRLFLREAVEKPGIAPLTSMFMRGENTLRPFVDYRPEVHDSDGLLIASGSGEWIWRPLDNTWSLKVSSFTVQSPRGFGLIQRDRDFDHYQDLEARSDLRPSAWIAPHGDWGTGRVELVEIPTDSDTNDNIVAFWVPDARPAQGRPLELAYSLYWYGDDPVRPPGGRAVATRQEYAADKARRLVVDFDGRGLRRLSADTVVRGAVSVARDGKPDDASLLEQQVFKNPVTGGWRLVFLVRDPGDDAVELRAFLEHRGKVLTETWSHLLRP